MGKFNGKTLLMLGSNVGATDIISYAKANGAYTIAADYYPVERSAAKRCADLALPVSTNDLDALSRIIGEYHVDGVLAGISEFNLLNAMELSRRHNLPFYCTREQWDRIESKDEFRRLCEENKSISVQLSAKETATAAAVTRLKKEAAQMHERLAALETEAIER